VTATRAPAATSASAIACPSPDRVIGDLGVEPQPYQHAKRPLTLAVVGQRAGAAALEQRRGGGQLRRVVAAGERLLDQLGGDPGGLQAGANPLGAPAVEVAAVLGEQPRVALVVDVALLDDDRQRLVDQLHAQPGTLQSRSQLGDAVLAAPEVAIAAPERLVQRVGALLRPVRRAHRLRRLAHRRS
jgi:hypothetical protein